MAHMTYKEKLNHIWTYYKWLLVVLIVLIMAVSILLACITNLRKINLMGGITVNIEMSDEGKAYLGDEFKEKIGTGKKRETVICSSMMVGKGETYEEGFSIQSVEAMCAGQDLDYMILDQDGFGVFLRRGIYKDLTELFSEEELLELQGKGIGIGYNSENEAIALDITDCPFAQKNIQTKDKAYFVVVVNAPNAQNCRAMIEHILAWEE